MNTFHQILLILNGYIVDAISYFSEDPLRIIGFVAMPIAFCGARLISRNGNIWLVHLLFVISNSGLIVFYFHNQHWELIVGQCVFLWTSIEGCFVHRPKVVPNTSPIGEAKY